MGATASLIARSGFSFAWGKPCALAAILEKTALQFLSNSDDSPQGSSNGIVLMILLRDRKSVV